jgi:cell division protein FtsL
MDKEQFITVLVVVVIVAAVVFGMGAISNMAGNTITGSVADEEITMEDEYFKVSDVEEEVNDTGAINDTQNNSR